jgi:peroxiredoxin
MRRYLVCLGLLAAPAAAQTLTAEQVLQKSGAAYASLKAVHVVAEREEAVYAQNGSSSSSSECELAAQGNRYYARFKLGKEEAIIVGDGTNIWRALPSRKQWTKVTAATLEGAGDEDEDADASPKDLHGVLETVLFYHFLALTKAARDAVLIKEEDYKLGHAKRRGYLLRGRTGRDDFEVLVNAQSFLVLRAREQRKSPQGSVEFITKVKQLETASVDDSLFAFEPRPDWSEVEMLVLPGEQRVLLTGERAVNFKLKTLDGETVALADLRGHVTVLDFWATWCGPCRAELPSMEKLYAEFGGEVRFYGVNDENSSTVKKFVSEKKLQMPVLLDAAREVHRRYGVRAIPTLLIIGPDGVIRQHYIGSRDESVLRRAIRAVLDGKA